MRKTLPSSLHAQTHLAHPKKNMGDPEPKAGRVLRIVGPVYVMINGIRAKPPFPFAAGDVLTLGFHAHAKQGDSYDITVER